MVPATLEDACGEQPGTICEWVYDATDGNEGAAELADWFVSKPLQILLIVLVAWVVARLARRWIRRAVRRLVAPDREVAAKQLRRLGLTPPPILTAEVKDPRRETRALVISTVVAGSVSTLIWSIALIVVLGRVGIDLAPLIAGAGIAGIAIGFGAQSLVKDFFAGLFLLLEDQYGIGDVVDLGEASGVVERFSLRATVLRGVDGTVWHVPNGEIRRVGNRSQLWSVALLDVDVAYQTDLAAARQVLHEAAAAVCEQEDFADQILERPQVLGVERLGIDGVTLRVTVKTTPGSQWAVQRALREAVKEAFAASGITIPHTQRAVWVKGGADADEHTETPPTT